MLIVSSNGLLVKLILDPSAFINKANILLVLSLYQKQQDLERGNSAQFDCVYLFWRVTIINFTKLELHLHALKYMYLRPCYCMSNKHFCKFILQLLY